MSDIVPDFQPEMLCGLKWAQASAALARVDCAIRRDHWCSPVVVLIDGEHVIDSDGDIAPFDFGPGDRSASDWSMVPRISDDGQEIPPSYRKEPHP